MRVRLGFLFTPLLILVLAACSRETISSISDKSIFETSGYMLAQDTIRQDISALATQAGNQIGKTRNEALVPLVFDSKGNLVTAEVFNTAVVTENAQPLEIYYTDLKTYKKVMKELVDKGKQKKTRLDEAQEKYTHVLPLGLNSNEGLSSAATNETPVDEVIYAFDPYETVHYTDEEIQTRLNDLPVEQKIAEDQLGTQLFSSTPPVWVGDIAVRKPGFNITFNVGHAGVVTATNCGTLRCSGNPNSDSTKTFEANIMESGTSDDLQEWKLRDQFDPAKTGDPIYLLWVPGTSDSQLAGIRDFHKRQNPCSYDIWTDKLTSGQFNGQTPCTWYCSLLVWRAYLRYTQKDLDPGGGYWVWPYDLVDSSYTSTYYVE